MLWQSGISEELKQIIKENLPKHFTILEYANARIYLAQPDTDFEFTGLEGCLCLLINRNIQSLFFNLYEYTRNNKELELELYTNIEKGYHIPVDTFHTIEYPFGIIGINYANKIEAEKMKKTIFSNSIILNLNPDNYKFINPRTSKIEYSPDPRQGNSEKLQQSIQNHVKSAVISDIVNVEKLVEFQINNDEGEIVFNIKKDEFDKAFSSQSLFASNFESHKLKLENNKIKDDSIVSSGKLNDSHSDAKFVEYDATRRKTIFPNINKKTIKDQRVSMRREYEREFEKTSLNMKDNDPLQRKSLKHIIHMQNRIQNFDRKSSIEKKFNMDKIKPVPKDKKESVVNVIGNENNLKEGRVNKL
jgi:hypothetical protein